MTNTSKNVATKVIATFVALILTLYNFLSNCQLYFKQKTVPWVQYPHPMQIFSRSLWEEIDIPFPSRTFIILLTIHSLNKKHNSVKFEYKISQTSITFLNKEVSIQNNKVVTKISITFLDKEVSIQNNKLTKIYWKTTDCQNFLCIDSDHPKSLKDSILYSQARRIKWICTTPNDFNQYCEELKQRFVSHVNNHS